MPLLPEQVRALWRRVEEGNLPPERAAAEEKRLLRERQQVWTAALLDKRQSNLRLSLLRELAAFLGIDDPTLIQRRCERALQGLKKEWTSTVDPRDPGSIERYYRTTQGTLYELMWWHALAEDDSPLAYVNALELAASREGRDYLDFGAGVGSGGLLFARAGFHVTLADVSLPLLKFARWRFKRRNLRARFIDVKLQSLPAGSFDMITAMDVFEHLCDPVKTVEGLCRALRPGGILVARLHAEPDPDRPQHIATDFEPVVRRLRQLGCRRIWVDDWLWGHQAFEKKQSAPGPTR